MNYLLQHLLLESATNYPDKPAVKYNQEHISYAELDQITNQLANVLVANGVKRGDRVGIYINKSIPSLISIYGILKAGAVYVPLDPQAPLDRIGYIIDNCQIKILLTSSAKATSVTTLATQVNSLEHVIFTDDQIDEAPLLNKVSCLLWSAISENRDQSLPEIPTIQTDLAYIIYTSGSTGNPKGVMISHLNSLTFVNWSYDQLKFSSEDVFSSHAPLHFDLSIFDVFVAAKSGGTLVLVPETLSMFPPRLSSWMQDQKISVWYSVPSILSMMVTHGQLDKRDFSNLRMVVFAGEVFPVKYLRQLMHIIPHPEYINLYGPTETNVVTYYKTPVLPESQTKPIPIGKCCENMEVFALSKEGKLITKPGEEGELMARGTCVAQGYWGDPDKTNKAFVKNPLQNGFDEKMYRTGDLVTMDEDGNYIYMGRIDHMIKSRGYRIEIGEIEAAIYGHTSIKEAAVIALPDDLITNRIKAIVVLAEEGGLDASELRMFCSKKLPKYMIPEIIEFRQELPKTSTGKVNKPQLVKESIPDN